MADSSPRQTKRPGSLMVDIEQLQPILKGLQSKTAKDESDAEYSEPPLREVVGIVFDVRIDRRPNAGNDADH